MTFVWDRRLFAAALRVFLLLCVNLVGGALRGVFSHFFHLFLGEGGPQAVLLVAGDRSLLFSGFLEDGERGERGSRWS